MKNILLFSTGLSPQVVTESIYYHTQIRRPPLEIDSIHIITDAKCESLIVKELLPENNGWLLRLAEDYHLDPSNVELHRKNIHTLTDKAGKPLLDLLTVDENQAAVETVFSLIKELTNDADVRLIASVAGGRKSMSVIVGQAMQFYAREQDLLTHVIVENRVLGLKDFYYPSPVSKIVIINGEEINYHDVKIHLDEIPFIRLRPILGEFISQSDNNSLTSLVQIAQKQIEDMIKPIMIEVDLKENRLTISEQMIKLPAKNLALYALLLQLRYEKYGEDKFEPGYVLADKLIEEKMLMMYFYNYQMIYNANNIYVENEKTKINNLKERSLFFTPKWLQETRSKINSKMKKALPPQIFALCQIQSVGGRFSTRYGVPVNPENIIIKNQG